MNQLRIAVECSSMLISTQMFRFSKAVEHFYYALLLSSPGYAQGGAAAWNSWASQGFHLAVRAAPPSVRHHDLLTVDLRPNRNFEVTASSENRDALQRLCDVLRDVEAARTRVAAATEEARLRALMDDAAVGRGLLAPVHESLKRCAAAPDAIEAFQAMLAQGLSGLTNWQIKAVRVSLR